MKVHVYSRPVVNTDNDLAYALQLQAQLEPDAPLVAGESMQEFYNIVNSLVAVERQKAKLAVERQKQNTLDDEGYSELKNLDAYKALERSDEAAHEANKRLREVQSARFDSGDINANLRAQTLAAVVALQQGNLEAAIPAAIHIRHLIFGFGHRATADAAEVAHQLIDVMNLEKAKELLGAKVVNMYEGRIPDKIRMPNGVQRMLIQVGGEHVQLTTQVTVGTIINDVDNMNTIGEVDNGPRLKVDIGNIKDVSLLPPFTAQEIVLPLSDTAYFCIEFKGKRAPNAAGVAAPMPENVLTQMQPKNVPIEIKSNQEQATWELHAGIIHSPGHYTAFVYHGNCIYYYDDGNQCIITVDDFRMKRGKNVRFLVYRRKPTLGFSPPPRGLPQHGNRNTCFLAATLIVLASMKGINNCLLSD